MPIFGNRLLQQQVDALATQLATLQSECEKLETKLNEAGETIETFAVKEADWRKKVAKAEADLKAERDSTKGKIEAAEKQIAKRVNAQLAAIGVNTFAPEVFEGPEVNSGENLLEKMAQLPPERQKEFYDKHKKEIQMLCLATQSPKV